MKDGERERPIENYGKKEQKEWLDNILPDPHPCKAGNKEEEHTWLALSLGSLARNRNSDITDVVLCAHTTIFTCMPLTTYIHIDIRW